MKTLEQQLVEYCHYQEELHGPIGIEELNQHGRATDDRRRGGAAETESTPLLGDARSSRAVPVLDLLNLDNVRVPSKRRRWSSSVIAVAATILLVVGAVVVVADRASDDVVTDPASSPSVIDEVVSPLVVDSDPAPDVADSLGYRWSRVPHDAAVFGGGGTQSQWMEGVTAGGPGLVAVGSDGTSAAVWTSADGATWERVPHDETVFGEFGEWMSMLSVTAGGPGLVAVGYEGLRFSEPGSRAAVWTSVDGRTWSRAPQDEMVFGGEFSQVMKSVTSGGPGLVAVGEDAAAAAVWTSVDGLTWVRVPHDDAIFPGRGGQGFGMTGVTVGGPGLVAVGGSDMVWTSVDGSTWSRAPKQDFGGGLMWGVTAGGPGLVAVGFDDYEDDGFVQIAVVWTSADGLTWSRVPYAEAVFGGPGENMSMNSVTSTDQGLVAVGFEGRFGDSGTGSGIGGSNRQQPGAGPLTSASAVVWTSVDGLAWSQVPQNLAVFGGGDRQWTGITSVTNYGDGLVAIGSDKTNNGLDAMAWVATPEE